MLDNQNTQIDVLLITAVKDELDVVLKAESNWQPKEDSKGFSYYIREDTDNSGNVFVIAAARPISMGGDSASNLATRLINELKPFCLVMAGICAGWRDKVFLGDVIIANRVFRYDAGKLKVFSEGKVRIKEELKDLHTHNLKPSLVQKAEDFPSDWIRTIKRLRPKSYTFQELWVLYALESGNDPLILEDRMINCPNWGVIIKRLENEKLIKIDGKLKLTAKGKKKISEEKIRRPDGPKERDEPKSYVGPIGTTNYKMEDPELFPTISHYVRKVLGVEMEASSIGLVAEIEDVPCIIVKAVSDFGDHEETDNFRSYAIEASYRFLMAFLKNYLSEFNVPIFIDNLDKKINIYGGFLPPFSGKMLGRDYEFNKIKTILGEEKKHVFVYGEHGIGKTMLAANICKEFKPCIWYSIGSEDTSLLKIFREVLYSLDNRNPPPEDKIEEKLKENIIKAQIKVIFLDNIDSIDLIKGFLSLCNTIEKPLLVTSHISDVNSEFDNKFKIKNFEDNKNIAKKLFKAHLPELQLEKNDEELIENICEILDYHPFDIKIVASQMIYYSELSELRDALLDEEAAIDIFKESHDFEPYFSHLTSLNLTYKNLNVNCQKNLSIIASFPQKNISLSLIKHIPEINHHCLKDLINLNLINFDRKNNRYEVHYLTQRFAREKLKEVKKKKYELIYGSVNNMIINSLKDYINKNSDWDDFSQRENIWKEKDNILGVMKWCDLSKDWDNLIEFENIMRHYLYVFGEWDERIKWSRKIWDLKNNKNLIDGRGYNIIMAGVEGLCFVYLQRDEVEEVNGILNIAQNHLPLNTENREWQRVWCFYHRIKGMLNYNADLFEDAKNNFETAIEYARKSHWETMEIPIRIQLGMPYIKQKKYDKAISILNNCIELASEHYEHKPKESPPYRRIVRALIWLGKCYCKIGNFAESREKFFEADNLYNDIAKLDEPLLIADLYFEWGLLEIKSKDYKKAKKLIGRIDEDIRYYWSADKLEKLYKIKKELGIKRN